MAVEFGLYYPPWNYTGKPDDLLDRVAGEVGIDHVTIPVVTGEQTQFRLSRLHDEPYFHTEGGWHFPPQAKLYTASGVRPRGAKWFGTRDVLDRIRERVDELGAKLILRIELPMVQGIFAQAPGMRYRSAWGELPSFGPCICNPQFRELVHSTLADLQRYDPGGFELANLCLEPWKRTFVIRRLCDITQLGEAASMCSCAACRQIATMAGVDAEGATQAARAYAESLVDRSAEQLAGVGTPAPDENLQAYKAARRTDCLRWLDRVAEDHPGKRLVLAEPRGGVDQGGDSLAGPRWISLGRGFREALKSYVDIIRGQTKGSGLIPGIRGRTGLQLPVWVPTGLSADGLVRLVAYAVREGVRFFDFEGVEESPPGAVTWLKQAVRYARREEGAA